jgi:hypothetical protein
VLNEFVAYQITDVVEFQIVEFHAKPRAPARRTSRVIMDITARISSLRRMALMFWALAW